MTLIEPTALAVPVSPPPPLPLPSLAEVALAAYHAGVTDARPAVYVTYAPTYIVHTPPAVPAGPGVSAFARPARRRYSLAEVVMVAGQVLLAGGVLDLAFSLVTGGVSYLLGLAPIGGALLVLGGAAGVNRDEVTR